jgi:type IV pilus assembly protein PilX
MAQPHHPRSNQRGVVLVTSLLLLLVVTIMALSMFRSFGMQEKIAGNVREKQRAIQAAASTLQYAEWWLATQSNAPVAVSAYAAASADVACVALVSANAGQGQICNNTLASNGISAASVPWTVAGAGGGPVGVSYTPSCMSVPGALATGASCISADVYYDLPRFYIADMGSYGRSGELYQVDAYSYGLSANAISVVESTVAVSCLVCNPGGL